MRRLMLVIGLAAAMAAAACGGETATSPSTVSNCAVPGNITNLSTTVSGNTVTFTWTPNTSVSVMPTDYVLMIGTSTGASNIGTFVIAGTTTYTWTNVAPGTYYARVQPRNSCGVGSSNEVNIVLR